MRMLIASEHERLFLECYCASRWHHRRHCRERRLRYIAVFGQLWGKLLLAHSIDIGCRAQSARTRSRDSAPNTCCSAGELCQRASLRALRSSDSDKGLIIRPGPVGHARNDRWCAKADLNYQLRSTVSFLVKPHFLHASERASNAPPNRIGVIRVMTISDSHCGHVDEAFSGGNSWPTT